MTEADEISVEDLRKAVLHLTDAVRLIATATDVFALRVAQSSPLSSYPDVVFSHSVLHEKLMRANDRLHAVVDLLVRMDDEHPS